MFTANEVTRLKGLLAVHLREFTEQHGLPEAEFSKGIFDHKGHCWWNVTLTQAGAVNMAESDFISMAPIYGIPAENFGKTFISNGKSFTISGFAPRNRKLPVLAKCVEGKGFKFPVSTVKAALGIPVTNIW